MADDKPLNYGALYDMILRDPRLAETFMRGGGAQAHSGAPVSRSGLNEAAAVADPFGATAFQRLLGMDISPMVLINEAHGLANKARRGY